MSGFTPFRSDEDLIQHAREWEILHGSPPRMKDWEGPDGDWPNYKQAVRRFGSWTAFITAAGLTPRPPGSFTEWARERARHARPYRPAVWNV